MSQTPKAAASATWDSVLAELAERREEFHAQGYVPRDFIEKFKPLGVYRAAAPKRFGGEPLPPAEFIGIVERVAKVDGSAGWVVAFASALTYLGALPIDTQAEIYRDGPDVVYAGGLFPMQPAAETGKGFLVGGRWKFASGCMGADLIGVGLLDEASEGRPRVGLLHKPQVEIVQDWDVTGMRASGSFDVVVRDVEVPREWTFVRGGPSTIDEPLFRYPLIGFQAQVHAAVGLGVAQAALEFVQRAGARTGVTSAPPMADRAYYRTNFAKAYAALHSARAFYYDVAHEVWQTVLTGDDVSPRQLARIRLSSANIADVCAQVVHDLCGISGAGIINNSHPLQLLRQDAHVPQLHATLGQAVYDGAGALLMGRPSTIPGFP
ncbi:acyl-CoA dehydrogenase family protein [Streptomyces sp. NPDC050619]|uniref:acyl-CoA dehydrogenase family protein n=1 Tax=Streptomyces sp. NPDC050619 TaxID=3157214 RepID=UPI0034265B78